MLKKILYTLLLGLIYLNANSAISDREIVTAIKSGLPATKKILKKVPIDYINNHDDTLLHYAVRFRKPRVVEYLVNQKILISRKGGLFDGTALQEAIYWGHLGIASFLIEMGSLVNVQNKYGETALHIAAKNGYLNIVKELLAQGASRSIVDNQGNTPYDLIPDLSWDSRKRLKELLRVRAKSKKLDSSPSDRLYMNIGRSRVEMRKNDTINLLHKTKIDNRSSIGVDVDVKRINRF